MRSRPPSRFWVGTSVPMPVSPAIDPDHASGYARTLVKAKSARQWTTMLGELEAFYEAYGHFWVEEHKGRYPALAVWWLRIRGRLETLTYDQVLGLDNLGFFGQIDQQWLNRYAQLRRFKKKHGHCKVPSLWPDNPSLGFWVSNQRQKAAELVMPAWRRKLLTDLGFCFRVPRTGPLAQWDEFIKCLKRYKKRFGNCNIPRNWSEDKRLNPWISQLRALRKSLDRDKVKQLDSLGFDWNPFASTWEKRFRELEKFKKQHGHYRVPRTARKLGNWVMSIRHRNNSKADDFLYIDTTKGQVIIKLRPDLAPNHVTRLLTLASGQLLRQRAVPPRHHRLHGADWGRGRPQRHWRPKYPPLRAEFSNVSIQARSRRHGAHFRSQFSQQPVFHHVRGWIVA